ncbi:MAG: hypothetical protein E7212_03020 [Clostridium sartagoforme]|nr:hypothetical protein [Clostridium sartagoforme]
MVDINKNNKRISIHMGWKHMNYIYGKEMLVFKIEPMIGEADIIYIPNDKMWDSSKIEWAKGDKEEILNNIKSIEWNRDIKLSEMDMELICISTDDNDIEKGTIESTEAAKEFKNLNLFDPDKKVSKEQAHELWCVLEKRFAENAKGKVEIRANDIIEGSVFDKITMPTLINNKNIQLFFIGR